MTQCNSYLTIFLVLNVDPIGRTGYITLQNGRTKNSHILGLNGGHNLVWLGGNKLLNKLLVSSTSGIKNNRP